ncbi:MULTISPECIES: SAM hydrolase/SAM-dependent halogenase family protein [Dehalococcoides]|nr:SAM-dependent chlorinase/fluorinase [Dehalococcoides mccartyi]AQW62956.1 S-adenosyl-l-methionine hydroxide adenosyltransferase [Dehalococcoides mccartyi]BAS32517.1 S-adenosyl-l-methionine hydroxide adenosyl transferase [Dehalococcoides mccartyi IBARAKI]
MGIITLTTDFGLQDAYVAAMKGVILSLNPDARILDVSHQVEPQNIQQAAFLLGETCHYFPADTIHLAVVDPGVGSGRRGIILSTPGGLFIGPDNGLFSYALSPYLPKITSDLLPAEGLLKLDLPRGVEAFQISNPAFWLNPVSTTFHGRDIFAPAAAYVSLGTPLSEFGPRLSWIYAFHLPGPEIAADGSFTGHVVYIDHFGNLITDITPRMLPSDKSIGLEILGRTIYGLCQNYTQASGLLAVIGSSGRLEIALQGGSAAGLLSARPGDCFHLSILTSPKD